MSPNPFLRCEKHVLDAFAAATATQRVFRLKDLVGFLRQHESTWTLHQHATTADLVEFLTSKQAIQAVRLTSEADYPPIRRFLAPGASPFEIALSLRRNSYLCHATAVFLHGLTGQIPQTIYVNREQSAKPRPSGPLRQEALDRAFRSHQRSSRYVFIHRRNRFVLLSGKLTGGYGVITLSSTRNENLRTTDLERTLIDITVRPVYGGGVHAVLAAFRSSIDRISFSKLLATLRALDYVYPYHQALGFYLERAGAPADRLEPLRALGLSFDFYLAHGIEHPDYDPSWRIHFPKGL